jgi:hypothetical protein
MLLKKPIPLPRIVDLYREMRKKTHAEQLAWALEIERDPGRLADCVAESIATFLPYENEEEHFGCRPHLAAPVSLRNGRDLESAVSSASSGAGKWVIRYGRVPVVFELVDYEVPSARTTKSAPLFMGKFDKGGNSLLIRTDLLLRAADGVPVIGEAKVAKGIDSATGGGFDSTPVVAFVQALAGGVLFATPSQLRRLRDAYKSHAFNSDAGCVELALFFYKPTMEAPATFQRRLEAATWVLAHRVFAHSGFPLDQIRRIWFVDVSGHPDAVSFRIWAAEP